MERDSVLIIFVPFITAFGGVERLILHLSRYLHDSGRRHKIVTFSNSARFESEATWPVEVVELRGVRNVVLETYRLRRWLRKNCESNASAPRVLAFDLRGAFYVVHAGIPFVVHLTDPPSLLPADISKYAPSLRREGRPSEPGASTMSKSIRAELTHTLNKYAVRRATGVIVMTNAIAREVASLYQVQPIVVRPGVNAPEQKTLEPHDASVIRFLSISRLVPTKRIDWILEALAELNRSGWPGPPQWELTVVGEGPEARSLAALAEQLQISNQIRWLGSVSDDVLELEYSRASIFLMPASQGWGLPAAEALVRRIPVVLHEDSGIAELLTNTNWVEVLKGNDTDGFTAAIRKLVARIRSPSTVWENIPSLASQSDWAAEICGVCGWM